MGELIITAKNKKIILEGGGHSMAAGFKINKNNEQRFKEYMESITPNIDIREKEFDLKIEAKNINLLLLQKLSILEPYGNGNRNPVLLITNIQCQKIKILKDIHIMCILNNDLKAFAFRSTNNNIGHFLLSNKQSFNIIGTISQFNGKVSIIIEDIIINK